MRRRKGGVAAAVVALVLVGAAASSGPVRVSRSDPIRIGVWGDMPYTASEVESVRSLIHEMNAADLDLTIFVGDIFGTDCRNEEYDEAVARFDSFVAPLVYTPGDNEWTDCHETSPVNRDALERLAFLRARMFAENRSFGQRKIMLEQQRPKYPENSRWSTKSALFVTMNVPGSNNGHIADVNAPDPRDQRSPEERRAVDDEHLLRDEANRDWLHASFELAITERAPVVVLAMQGDPGFNVEAGLRATKRVDGFDRLLDALVAEVKAFGKPVVLIHGDSHRFAYDQPLVDPTTLERVGNFTRVETFGSPDVGWVHITIDTAAPDQMRVVPRLVHAR